VDPKVGGSIPLTHPNVFSPVTPRRSTTYEGKPPKSAFHPFPSFSGVFRINPERKSKASSSAASGWRLSGCSAGDPSGRQPTVLQRAKARASYSPHSKGMIFVSVPVSIIVAGISSSVAVISSSLQPVSYTRKGNTTFPPSWIQISIRSA
jgi:hypothetical protein